ncbi:hypothetical protein [Butyrivibrio sp. MB2005]|uniref:hypothetical protein n=1 Tax=Butyrivibrio sp. MB2005 TaxID=1280678 RepID=UPI000685FEBC|nr:hypothetical protein [Butyrivibrio sp. MB2005]
MRIASSNINLISERKYVSRSEFRMEKGMTSISNKSEGVADFRDVLFTNYNAEGEFAVMSDTPEDKKVSEIDELRRQIVEKLLNIMQILFGGSEGKNSRTSEYMKELTSKMNAGSYQLMSVTTSTYTRIEEEHTAFEASGIAMTEDGRELHFGINVSMTSRFCESIGVTHMQPAQLIDPLVINVGSGVTSISDQSFTFDLDADGEEDEIKKLGHGSGFLAYDRNGDGVINNGTELFGAKSGDGFAELSEFDKDNNNWIDENDEIYEKLRVWCHDENGKETLMTLKEADVGAIYLGKADTDFTSRGSDFMINAQFRSSGVFLKESTGEAGVVHQIDMAKIS